jgi:glycosyltransferase involved in cell wall biosynthesis
MDEIIIVDTGSTDKTKEIAKQYTDQVYDYVWVDDFSDARNFSFSKAAMDYIYVADADEVVDEENRKRFLQLKETLLPVIDIVQMKYCNQLEFNTTYNFDVEYRPKLYKRLRTFQWIEPVHEMVRLDPVIFDSDIEILHKPISNHAGRDFSIFQRFIRNGRGLSKKLHHMYARELFIAGEDKDFIEAAEYFHITMSEEGRNLDELKEAACVVAKADRLKKDITSFFTNCIKDVASNSCSEICYELGEFYFELQDYKEATIWYYNAAYETESILNIHYGGDMPLYRLSQCFDKLNNKEQAKEYENLAEEWSC